MLVPTKLNLFPSLSKLSHSSVLQGHMVGYAEEINLINFSSFLLKLPFERFSLQKVLGQLNVQSKQLSYSPL